MTTHLNRTGGDIALGTRAPVLVVRGEGRNPHLRAIEMAGTARNHIPDIAQHGLVQAPLKERAKAVDALWVLKGRGGWGERRGGVNDQAHTPCHRAHTATASRVISATCLLAIHSHFDSAYQYCPPPSTCTIPSLSVSSCMNMAW